MSTVAEFIVSWCQSPVTQTVCAAVAVLLVIRHFSKKSYNLPPGPRPLPLLGNVLAFRCGSITSVLERWHREYGPVVTVYVGPMPIIVIGGIQELIEAFVKKGSDFSGRPHLFSTNIFTDGTKDIVFATYGEAWKFQRKIAVQALRKYLVGRELEERVNEALQPILEIMVAQKGAFDPHEYISSCVFNIIHGLCFGNSLNHNDPSFKHLLSIFDCFNDNLGNGFLEDFFSPLRIWPTKKFKNVRDVLEVIKAYMYKTYAEHKQDFDENDVKSVVDNIILAQKQAVEEKSANMDAMTDAHTGQIMLDFFGAGVEPSRITLDWVILVIASRPEIQARLHKELDVVVGDNIPGKEHRTKLVYLEAVLLETMRMFPVAPVGVPHSTMRDTKIGQYEIPANTFVLSNQLQIMSDPNTWEDPMVFKPERFLDESQTSIVQRNPSWIPFSIGQRSCLGESLAKLKLVLILANILQKLSFCIEFESRCDLIPNPDGATNKPKPYKVNVTAR